MLKNVAPNAASGWLLPSACVVLAVTAYRLILLSFNQMDIFVDEAQYWLWGQELAFGYYSKPPMIGWLIRGVTELAGSDAPFWLRFPAPILHAITALILGAIAALKFGRRAALTVSAGYATLPMVSVGSILISTDTVMFPFLAAALLGYIRAIDRPSTGIAVLTGLALGLAFMSKYAAIYFVVCALIASLFMPKWRISARSALVIMAAFLAAISPNMLWNIWNGFSTLQHTLDNADWVRDPSTRAGLNAQSLLSFFSAQFFVFGPILFTGLMWFALRSKSGVQRFFLIFSLPILAIVCAQALLSNAYANWAASAYIAGSLAVLPFLSRPFLLLSFAINGTIALALPALPTNPTGLVIGKNPPLLERYMGRDELSLAIISAARKTEIDTIVAQNRDILADLFYTGRNSGLAFYAAAPRNRAPHHYALKFPFTDKTAQTVIFVTTRTNPRLCPAHGDPVHVIEPTSGAYAGKTVSLYLVPGACIK